MSHVTERLAEYMFEELPASEMAEARRHLADCANCREQVERFQQTLAMLKTSPDLDPPRNIVFEFEKPAVSRLWRWFPAGVAVAALLLIMIALAGGTHVQWHDSQLTIAFGQAVAPEPAAQTPELATEIQNMKASMAYLQAKQQEVERNTFAIAAAVQPTVQGQRSPTGD